MADPDPSPLSPPCSTLPRSAKRCRIPRLNRSVSVRTTLDPPLRSEGRPKSLTVGSADYPWRLADHLGSSMHSMVGTPFDDDSSVKSFGSYASYASFASQSQCGTEASSRPVSRSHYGKRYVLHCDRHMVKPEEYLTPTQRKEKEIRQLKSALARQTKRCDDKDQEIEGLREEMRRLRDALEELQLGKHSLMNSSQESDNLEESMNAKNNNSSVISFESNSSDDIHTVTNNNNNNDDSGISTSISPRNSSEEFEDIVGDKVDKCVCTDDCMQAEVDYSKPKAEVSSDYPKSKEEVSVDYSKSKTEVSVDYLKPKAEVEDGVVAQRVRSGVACLESHQTFGATSVPPSEFERFLGVYKQELEQLKSQHKEHYQDLKERFNDRVDDLLQKLTEANTRYLELRPLFDRAQDKIHTIESQLCDVQKDMESQEDYHNQMYLRMYRKGQEAARFEEEAEEATPKPLRQQLQQLENELEQTRRLYREATTRGSGDRQAEYTLRFLKDAVFYFLTKKDKEHLKAIQSILGFTDAERVAVAKAMKHRRL